MASYSSVCSYRVIFSDGTVMYPKLPGSVDVYRLANNYAKETLSKDKIVTVINIESLD